MCPKNGMAASVWGFNVRTDVYVHDCAQGLYRHCKRNYSRREIPCHSWDSKSNFCHSCTGLAFQSNTLPTELFLIIKIKNTWTHLPSPAHWYSRLPSGSPGPVCVGLALNSAALQGALLAMFPLCGQIPSLTAPVSMRTGCSVSWFPSTSVAGAVMISSCCC